jgi:hypothetical protein
MRNKSEITIIVQRRIKLFPLIPTNIAPIALRVGRPKSGKREKIFLSSFMLQKFKFPFLKQTKTPPINMKIFKPIIKGTNESGCDKPKKTVHSFIKSPMSIKKAMLNPAEKRTVSSLPSSNLSNLMIMNPGIKVK